MRKNRGKRLERVRQFKTGFGEATLAGQSNACVRSGGGRVLSVAVAKPISSSPNEKFRKQELEILRIRKKRGYVSTQLPTVMQQPMAPLLTQ